MRRLAIGAALLLATSCNGDSEVGGMEVDLYDVPVDCGEGPECLDAWGADATPERLGGFAFITTETSAHHPDGLFVYFEVARPDGSIGRGELDVPLRGEGEPRVDYEERTDTEVTFVAEEVVGVVEVPEEALGEDCDCLDGRLELVVRNGDGEVRRLSRGRFGWGDRPCVGRARFTDLEERLVVVPRTCGVEPVPTTPRYDPPRDDGDDYYYAPSRDYGSCDTSGCSGSGGSSSSCDSSGGGCDGGGGGGCEGDTGGAGGCAGDTGGAGGCAGDAGGGGGCAGDTGGCRVGHGPRRVGPRGPLQTGLVIAAALLWVIRPRRRR